MGQLCLSGFVLVRFYRHFTPVGLVDCSDMTLRVEVIALACTNDALEVRWFWWRHARACDRCSLQMTIQVPIMDGFATMPLLFYWSLSYIKLCKEVQIVMQWYVWVQVQPRHRAVDVDIRVLCREGRESGSDHGPPIWTNRGGSPCISWYSACLVWLTFRYLVASLVAITVWQSLRMQTWNSLLTA